MQKTTIDGILNKRVMIEQPADGFRVAVDTVLLASAIDAVSGQRVMEFGCGVGGVMLSLACRVSGLVVHGMEIQHELAQLCSANIDRNGFSAELRVTEGDVLRFLTTLYETYDHVVMNPPYHDAASHNVSGNDRKRIANTEMDGELEKWISGASNILKNGGKLSLIHRADRLDEILDLLKSYFGAVLVKPILPKAGLAPKRIILRSEKGGGSEKTVCKPLVLHNMDGSYTAEADDILRNAEVMKF